MKRFALLALLLPLIARADLCPNAVTHAWETCLSGTTTVGTVTSTSGASYAVVTANIAGILVRSNSGSSMTDTLPSAVTAGKNWQVMIINADASATDTVTPAAGTIGGGASLAILAGQAAFIYSDGSNYQISVSSPTVSTAATVTSLTASGTVAANAVTSSTTGAFTGKVTSGDAIYSTGGTQPSPTTGQGSFIGSATNGLQLEGDGSSNDYQLLNSSGSQVCATGHGLNSMSCQQIIVTGTNAAAGNGLYRPAANELGFETAALSAGMIDSGQHPRFGGSGSPTISSGACGTTSNGTIAAGASDVSGEIVIGAAATLTCTVSFNKTYETVARAVLLQAGNAAAAGQVANVYVSSITTTTFVVTGTALANTSWYFYVE